MLHIEAKTGVAVVVKEGQFKTSLVRVAARTICPALLHKLAVVRILVAGAAGVTRCKAQVPHSARACVLRLVTALAIELLMRSSQGKTSPACVVKALPR